MILIWYLYTLSQYYRQNISISFSSQNKRWNFLSECYWPLYHFLKSLPMLRFFFFLFIFKRFYPICRILVFFVFNCWFIMHLQLMKFKLIIKIRMIGSRRNMHLVVSSWWKFVLLEFINTSDLNACPSRFTWLFLISNYFPSFLKSFFLARFQNITSFCGSRFGSCRSLDSHLSIITAEFRIQNYPQERCSTTVC